MVLIPCHVGHKMKNSYSLANVRRNIILLKVKGGGADPAATYSLRILPYTYFAAAGLRTTLILLQMEVGVDVFPIYCNLSPKRRTLVSLLGCW